MKRTHLCGQVTQEQVEQMVSVCGWVHSYRDHGGVLFIDLRDREGLLQIVVNPEPSDLFEIGNELRSEFVISVTGRVRFRPEGTVNSNLKTGRVEVVAESIEILNQSETPPFEVSEFSHASEEIRLRYRYLDLRRPTLQRNLKLRHELTRAVRDTLNQERFLEIETPFLNRSTPEGARDFLVPSRLNAGQFYALPQSPQLFKQILMAGGMEKYYQIARCFRDEDLRADRQPEFTQVDIEMSFVNEMDVMSLTEKILVEGFKATLGKDCALPFPKLSWKEAMNRFGSDKPDLRFDLELVDLNEELRECGFKVFSEAIKNAGTIKALCLKEGAKCSRGEIDQLTEYVKGIGAKGLAWMKVTEEGAESNIVKFFTVEEIKAIKKKAQAQTGDLLLFGAGNWKEVVSILGLLRVELNRRFKLIPESEKNELKFVWIVDFPLLEWDSEEKRWNALHHPFTAPHPEDIPLLETDPGKVRSRAYDIVLNGTELGGGSIRIHQSSLQSKLFDLLGIPLESAQEKFGFLLEALKFGTPPHGGIALGLDRWVALALGEDSIRDTIAFPKTQKGQCLLSGAPGEVSQVQLKELRLKQILIENLKQKEV